MPLHHAVWTESEISACFDDAFEHLFAGDFVSAAACFQRVIDESGHGRARSIAQRDLEWWCLPLELIVTRLRDTPKAWTLDELLAECLGPDTFSEYRQQISDSLQKIVTVCYLGDQLWAHRSCFETAIGLIVTWLRETNLPITLSEVADHLLMELDCPGMPTTELMESAIDKELSNIDGLFVMNDGCVLDKSSLQSFRVELVEAIVEGKRPTRLITIIDRMPWPQSVKAALKPSSLRNWLHSLHGREENLCEIGDDWWFINRLLDLSDAPAAEVFENQFDILDTKSIVLKYLFGGSQPQKHAAKGLIQPASKQLSQNPLLVRVGTDRWFLAQTLNDLAERMVDHLAQASQPMTLQYLLKTMRSSSQRKLLVPDLVQAKLLSELRQDDQILEVCEAMWLHRSSMETVLERAYELLQDSVARSTSDLLSQYLEVPGMLYEWYPTFVNEFEAALHNDGRFILNYRLESWIAIPPGIRRNDLAYVILYREHRPLTRQGVVDHAKNMPHSQSLDFELKADTRFEEMSDDRWMLAHWVLINDLAAIYLAQSPIPLLAETVKKKVCQVHSIPLAVAIFEPEGDSRFVRDSLGKWTCTSPGMIVTAEMLEQLVMAASHATDGISLEALARRSLNDHPSAFINLEEVLEADGRLVHCNDLWYPRDKCFYSVTRDDLDRIKAHIEAVGYPIPTETLAQVCLDRFVCLTDLREKLAETEHFIELGSAGWIVGDLQLESRTRGREVNYPIRSGKYLPTIDPAEFESIEEEERSEILHDLPTKASDEWKEEGRVRSISTAMSFEDLRDGTLVVTSRLRSLLGDGIDLSALRFVDESGAGFSCWYDAENKLLYGFGRWFNAQGLIFGDKVRLSITNKNDQFLIQAVGERNEQIYLEGIRRSNVQSLIDEAKRVNRSYHDLALEVLEHFGIPLHIDDLWGMVNYRRTARKGTLSAILSSCSYFVSEGAGYWYFDKEEYARMIRDLERKVKKLERENQTLRDRNAEFGVLHNERLQRELEELEAQLKASRQSCSQYEREIGELRREVDAANNRASDAEVAANQAMQENNLLQKSLVDARQRINELGEGLEREVDAVSTLEEERKQPRARVTQLTTKTENMARLDDDLQQSIKEVEELRQQNQTLSADNDRLRKEVEALTNQVQDIATLRAEQEQLKIDLAASREALERSDSENKRLSAELGTANDSAEKSKGLVDEISEEHKQLEASLAAAERQILTLTSEVQEKNDIIGKADERNQTLSAEVVALSTQVTALDEQQSQLNDQIAVLEKALQRATAEFNAVREQSRALGAELAQQALEKQQVEEQLASITDDLESSRSEHAKALAVLDSWSGRLAKWWVMIRSRDVLT